MPNGGLRVVAAPASLKGVLSAPEAAEYLAIGLAMAGAEGEPLPIADGGEGTADVLSTVLGGEWRHAVVSDPLGRPIEARYLLLPDNTAVVESAEAIGLPRLALDELDPLRATSFGLEELILAALAEAPSSLLICLGGSSTVDGGAGLRAAVGTALQDVHVRVACDVANPLLGDRGAARAFGPQKGATHAMVEELEERLSAMPELAPVAGLPGAGAAGGLGAALALLGGQLVSGAQLVLETVRFHDRIRDVAMVVTGEGTVDRTSAEGKGPGAVLRTCQRGGVPCVVFGGRVVEPLPGAHTLTLSGDPARARDDLLELGEAIGRQLRTSAGFAYRGTI